MAMHVEVFRHRVDPDFQGEFDALYARMVTIVKGLKGYMSHKVFTAEDGEKVLIGSFEGLEAIEQWDVNPEHQSAKDRGKTGVFLEYDVVVAEVIEHEVEAKIAALTTLDFGPKDGVKPGAVVRFGERYLVIGVSTAEFQCQGKKFIGISPAAPIYDALKGKAQGDDCEFRGRTLHLREVY